jgi:hypothetical protein
MVVSGISSNGLRKLSKLSVRTAGSQEFEGETTQIQAGVFVKATNVNQKASKMNERAWT